MYFGINIDNLKITLDSKGRIYEPKCCSIRQEKSYHITFLYLSEKFDNNPDLVNIIQNIVIDNFGQNHKLLYNSTDLFKRFIVLKYQSKTLSEVYEKIYNEVLNLLQQEKYKEYINDFVSRNNPVLNTHITIYAINTPSEIYCNRTYYKTKLELLNMMYKNAAPHIHNIPSSIEISKIKLMK